MSELIPNEDGGAFAISLAKTMHQSLDMAEDRMKWWAEFTGAIIGQLHADQSIVEVMYMAKFTVDYANAAMAAENKAGGGSERTQ